MYFNDMWHLELFEQFTWRGLDWGAREATLPGQDTAEEISAVTKSNKPQQLPN